MITMYHEQLEKDEMDNPWIRSVRQKIDSTYHPFRETPLRLAFPLVYGFLDMMNIFSKKSNDQLNHEVLVNKEARQLFKKIFLHFSKDKYKNKRHQSLYCIKDKTQDYDRGKEFNDDPFLNFGSGIAAYRGLLRNLIVVFLLISMLMIPVAKIYHDNHELQSDQSWLSRYSLGNMGFLKS